MGPDLCRTNLRTGQISWERVYGITSLSSLRADAALVLGRVRQHWIIKNGSRSVSDVTIAEEHSQVRTGSTPQVMAALRNMAIALLRTSGETTIARACRRHTTHPWQALALLGITPTKTICPCLERQVQRTEQSHEQHGPAS